MNRSAAIGLLAALLAIPLAHGAPAEDGEALLAASRYKDALQWFRERAESSDTPCEYLLRMARAQLPLAGYRSALESAQLAFRAAASAEQRAAALTLAGRAYLEAAMFRPAGREAPVRGDLDEAFEQSGKLLRRALEESPETAVEALYWLGYLETRLTSEEKAIPLLEEYLARAPESYYSPGAKRLLELVSEDQPPDAPPPIHIVEHDDSMIPPERKRGARPSYPPDLRSKGIQGLIQVHGIITKAGVFEDVVILKGVDPRLDAVVLQTVRGWKFRPARLQEGRGKVAVHYTLSVNMYLRK